MTVAHPEEDGLQDSGFKEEIEPGEIDECTEVEHPDAQVKGEHLASGHQGAAAATEGLTQFQRNVISVGLLQTIQHLLAGGGHVLLPARVPYIKEEV